MGEIIIGDEPLTTDEHARLSTLEQTIKENFLGFVAVGNALAEIRERRLYRNDEGRTFEAYCRELWDMARRTADQLVSASKVVQNLSAIALKKDGEIDQDLLPANEAQARELARLEPDAQRQVWRGIIEQTEDGKITARKVKVAVKEYQGEKIEEQVKKTGKKLRENSDEKASEPFIEAWDIFWGQVQIEKKSNWKHTSKKVVAENLQTLTGLFLQEAKNDAVAPACSMSLSDREKLNKAGFRIFRMHANQQVIEEWDKYAGWMVSKTAQSPTKLLAEFNELMKEPKNLRA